MDTKRIIENVDVERLYKHVLELEGWKHALDSPEGLKKAADYIYTELESYGISVRRQTFKLDGIDVILENIEGWVGDENQPAAVIVGHYDTVFNSPGANDDAAAIAVILETARILGAEQAANGVQSIPCVRFLAVAMEEGNVAYEAKVRASAQKYGIKDEKQRFATWEISKIMQEHQGLATKIYGEGVLGKTFNQALAEATSQMQDRLPKPVLNHLRENEELYKDVVSHPGISGHMGSWAWMKEALELGKKIKYGLVLDEIGRTRKEENTQTLPPIISYDMMQTYKIDPEKKIGDWVFLVTNGPAEELAKVFCKNCETKSVELPYGHFHFPMNYEQICKEFPMSLGSDYTAFWGAEIPALGLLDTFSWRPPYMGHTNADTIDIIDFDQVDRICKAVIATTIDSSI